jgi:uncharacterized phage protein (TIGR01671 family)
MKILNKMDAADISTKFRAYDKLKEQMITEGFHVIGEVTMFMMIDKYIDENREGKSSLDRYGDIIVTQFSGFQDKNGKDIYSGDIVELVNEGGEEIRAVCRFGKAIRTISGNDVEISGFYFELSNGNKTFPIINNYQGKHDTELFEVVGHIW